MASDSLTYNLILTLKYFTFILFIIGLLFNADGFQIAINSKNYLSGNMLVDSLHSGVAVTGPQSTVSATGKVDSVRMAIVLGNSETDYVDSILSRHSEGQNIVIPVWYKSDGKLTIDRYKGETSFPVWRIISRLILYVLCLNGPFLLFWILQRHMKKKEKLLKRNTIDE